MKLAALVVACLVVFGMLCLALWAYTPDKARADIEAKYNVARTDYIDVAGVRLHLLDSGPRSAPVVVLLHGFGSSLETWDRWSDALAHDFRIVRFDWPGFGLSGLDAANDYSDRRSLDVLLSVLNKLGIDGASLIGNSMGGKLAWMFAAAYPARVDKLILISPDGFASPDFEYGKQPAIPLTLRLLPYVLPTPLVRMSIKPAYADPTRLSDATVERYRDFMLAPGIRTAMIARMEQTILAPPEPILGKIQAPTLLVWGREDGMIPFGNSADYVRLIPHVTLVALPDTGHVPQEEAPEASLKPVEAFLMSRSQ